MTYLVWKVPSCGQFIFRKSRHCVTIDSKWFGNGSKNSCLGKFTSAPTTHEMRVKWNWCIQYTYLKWQVIDELVTPAPPLTDRSWWWVVSAIRSNSWSSWSNSRQGCTQIQNLIVQVYLNRITRNTISWIIQVLDRVSPITCNRYPELKIAAMKTGSEIFFQAKSWRSASSGYPHIFTLYSCNDTADNGRHPELKV